MDPMPFRVKGIALKTLVSEAVLYADVRTNFESADNLSNIRPVAARSYTYRSTPTQMALSRFRNDSNRVLLHLATG